MISGRRTAKDLVEEAKKRVVLLLICVFGLSYLMSLTSSSVWINLPAAAALIIFGRYVSLDLDIRRRPTIEEKLSTVNQSSLRKSVELHEFPIEKQNWRRKVNSPPVEAAIEQFTRHLVSEWVTDLWYSRVTPDRDGPEELVQIMNNVLAEISSRARDINLINLLTRDIINLFCNHLELYRLGQSKIKKEDLRKFPTGHEDTLLRLVLAADNKLHPALFSVEAEHKVLQHLMNGLIQITFRPEDLHCTFFRYTVRELLACAVFRPVLNLANPRVINEKIESLVLSLANKADKGIIPSAEQTPTKKPPPMPSSDEILGFQDRSTVGVELVKVRHALSSTTSDEQVLKNSNGAGVQEISINSSNVKANAAYTAGGEWAQMLDMLSRRKTQVLAPENLDSMWTKGRNYKKKEGKRQVANQVRHSASVGSSNASQDYMEPSNGLIQDRRADIPKRNNASFYDEERNLVDNMQVHSANNRSTNQPVISYQDRTKDLGDEEVETDTEGSYQSEDDDNNTVTGLDSPGTRVWDSKNKTCAAVQYIRHPLETSDLHLAKKTGRGHSRHPRIMRTSSGRKRPRSSNLKIPTWQEVERTSFLLGEGHDILHEAKHDSRTEESSDDPDAEIWSRIHSGEAASSSLSSISTTESCNSSLRSLESSVLADSFLKLRCEVLGANIVKSGPGTFAVYSIAVTDANNNSWSIKRRYRHFEELHKRLKEFQEYNLSLPPKHFLSSGLDVPVVQERCKLLDKYLKMLLQLPTISGSIEVWDFLSVDSQTYMFSDSLSIIQTLSVNLADKSRGKGAKGQNLVENISGQLSSNEANASKQYNLQTNKNYIGSDIKGLRKRNIEQNSGNSSAVVYKNSYQENAGGDSEDKLQTNTSSSSNRHRTKEVGAGKADDLQETSSILETDDDAIIPTEWVPPNLSVPILNLVDVVFQLQDGGWIRRQAFRVAKQLLQLGMGDAFDDWLIEKIQLLRKGTVIASAINQVERILWPDGIFLTKHPNRKPPTPVSSPGSQDKNITQKCNSVKIGLTYEQQLEAERRAKFVYELMIDKAPPTLVSLVGRKEYEQCTQDVYFFLQSSVCLKQLALELLELILLALFPELDDVVRQCHEDKERFGAVEK